MQCLRSSARHTIAGMPCAAGGCPYPAGEPAGPTASVRVVQAVVEVVIGHNPGRTWAADPRSVR